MSSWSWSAPRVVASRRLCACSAGLEEISEGEILIDGRSVNHLGPGERDIAMVFQDYALYPHMTVAQNIGFSLRLARVPKNERRERVAEAARILELSDLLDRKPGRLSGGQRQRVAMGRAIVRRPKLFLLDEPLSNLDANLRVQMRGEISELQERLEVTTFYVTHDQVEAMTMADRGRGHQPRGAATVRRPPRHLRCTRQRLRGRLHGVTVDEPHGGRDHRPGRKWPLRGGRLVSDTANRRGCWPSGHDCPITSGGP